MTDTQPLVHPYEAATSNLVRRYAALKVADATQEYGLRNAQVTELHDVVDELRRRNVLD